MLKSYINVYVDIECTYALCLPCRFYDEHIFTLKGLPTYQNSMELKYIFLDNELLNGRLIFQGLLGQTFITFDRASRAWNMFVNGNESKVIGQFSSSSKFPLGLNTWNFSAIGTSNFGAKQIKFTKVSEQ